MKQQYYSCDPNVSRDGRVLTIEGLDSNFIDQGSEHNCHSTKPKNIEIKVPNGNANNNNNQQNSQTQQPQQQQQQPQQQNRNNNNHNNNNSNNNNLLQ